MSPRKRKMGFVMWLVWTVCTGYQEIMVDSGYATKQADPLGTRVGFPYDQQWCILVSGLLWLLLERTYDAIVDCVGKSWLAFEKSYMYVVSLCNSPYSLFIIQHGSYH